jgi:hypothetical protein
MLGNSAATMTQLTMTEVEKKNEATVTDDGQMRPRIRARSQVRMRP